MKQPSQETCPKSRASPTMDIQLQPCPTQCCALGNTSALSSCHHSGPSAQGTASYQGQPNSDKRTIAVDTPTPLCPSLPGKKKDKAFNLFTRHMETLVLGMPLLCFQQHSLRAAGKLLCVQVPQAKEPQSCPVSLLATCALLLHTLSPLCDQNTVRKGLLVCMTIQIHRSRESVKLPAWMNGLLVLTWPSWCRGCSETG